MLSRKFLGSVSDFISFPVPAWGCFGYEKVMFEEFAAGFKFDE
jgi:hypothetical protein